MLDDYLNYIQELNMPGKCNRLKNKINFHKDELEEEYVNLKKCRTYWLSKEKVRTPEFNNPDYRKKQYKACVKKTNYSIQRQKKLLSDAQKKYKAQCS